MPQDYFDLFKFMLDAETRPGVTEANYRLAAATARAPVVFLTQIL
jgi:hypothetical protein